MRFRHVSRRGEYYRVADPAWSSPLEGRWSLEAGGRWNPPAAFPVVYLFSRVDVARSFVLAKHAGQAFSFTDLLPERRPNLVATTVPPDRFVDAVSDAGCKAAGLPSSYPRDRSGKRVAWETCRAAGQAAWDQGEAGIACRSATARSRDTGEELAWFARRRRLRPASVRAFDEWFPA